MGHSVLLLIVLHFLDLDQIFIDFDSPGDTGPEPTKMADLGVWVLDLEEPRQRSQRFAPRNRVESRNMQWYGARNGDATLLTTLGFPVQQGRAQPSGVVVQE